MVLRSFVLSVLCCILFAAKANAQPGDHRLDMKSRVLDILFPAGRFTTAISNEDGSALW